MEEHTAIIVPPSGEPIFDKAQPVASKTNQQFQANTINNMGNNNTNTIACPMSMTTNELIHKQQISTQLAKKQVQDDDEIDLLKKIYYAKKLIMKSGYRTAEEDRMLLMTINQTKNGDRIMWHELEDASEAFMPHYFPKVHYQKQVRKDNELAMRQGLQHICEGDAPKAGSIMANHLFDYMKNGLGL